MIFALGLFLLLGGFVFFCLSVGIYIGTCADISKTRQFVGIIIAIISVISFFYGVYLIGSEGLTLLGVI